MQNLMSVQPKRTRKSQHKDSFFFVLLKELKKIVNNYNNCDLFYIAICIVKLHRLTDRPAIGHKTRTGTISLLFSAVFECDYIGNNRETKRAFV